MTPEEQVEFARRRCRELLPSRLASHNVERSLRVDGLDPAIIEVVVDEYETLLAAARLRDRRWWQFGALIVLLCCLCYLVPQLFQANIRLHKGHAVFLGIAVLALLQLLLPNPRQLT